MIKLRAENDRQNALGHARLVIEGISKPADATFQITREGYAAANLGRRGWQVQEEKLRPVSITQEGSLVVFTIGPGLTRHLEPGPLIFTLPGSQLEAPLFWPDDIEVFDGDIPPDVELPPEQEAARPPLITPAPPAAAPAPPKLEAPPIAEPPPLHAERVPTSSAPNRIPLIAGLGILALGAIAAGFWFLRDEAPQPAQPTQQAQAPAPAPSPAPTPAPTAPPERPWIERTDTMALRELVQTAPNLSGIFDAALRRQAAGRHDDALVLFEEAGERGHAAALTALARLYDPNGFVAGRPFRNPDPRAAARYYRDAVQKGDDAATAPRAALKSHLEELARAGNGTAETALRDFWP